MREQALASASAESFTVESRCSLTDILDTVAMDPVASFAEIASEFCALVEGRDALSVIDLLRQLRRSLPALYHAAVMLPETDGWPGLPEERDMSTDEWFALMGALRAKFGTFDIYWEVFDPFVLEEADPMNGSLSDDIADIYRDIKPALVYWEKDRQAYTSVVAAEWRGSMEAHWGHHAIDALRQIHALFANHRIEDDAL